MTNYQASENPISTNSGMPGAAPLGAQMNGNPQGATNAIPAQDLSGNQNAPQQLTSTQVSSGNIIASSVPTNVATAPGTDSLLAQMSRGQVIMADSTYGQSQFVPANGGAGQSPGVAGAVPVTARVASTLTYPAPGAQNYTGT